MQREKIKQGNYIQERSQKSVFTWPFISGRKHGDLGIHLSNLIISSQPAQNAQQTVEKMRTARREKHLVSLRSMYCQRTVTLKIGIWPTAAPIASSQQELEGT